MITAKIIRDSISPVNKRIITWELEYPRFNAASSRAIPIEKMIQQVIDNPAMPVFWGKNQAGMQAKEELDNIIKRGIYIPLPDDGYGAHIDWVGTDLEYAKYLWLAARDSAVNSVRQLASLGLHKQIANRILEPWSYIKVVMTTTESDNWYNLRDHVDAQPEIHDLASIMLQLENESNPEGVDYGEWHLPYVEDEVVYDQWATLEEGQIYIEDAKKLSASLCAQVSYRKSDDSLEKALKIYDRLVESKPAHASPVEHQATPLDDPKKPSGNFRGWQQNRQLIKGNTCFEYPKLVKKKYKRKTTNSGGLFVTNLHGFN
jgi:hypothetical protein